jgi:hypothetical protein
MPIIFESFAMPKLFVSLALPIIFVSFAMPIVFVSSVEIVLKEEHTHDLLPLTRPYLPHKGKKE